MGYVGILESLGARQIRSVIRMSPFPSEEPGSRMNLRLSRACPVRLEPNHPTSDGATGVFRVETRGVQSQSQPSLSETIGDGLSFRSFPPELGWKTEVPTVWPPKGLAAEGFDGRDRHPATEDWIWHACTPN